MKDDRLESNSFAFRLNQNRKAGPTNTKNTTKSTNTSMDIKESSSNYDTGILIDSCATGKSSPVALETPHPWTVPMLGRARAG